MTTYYFADNYNSEGHANITGSALGDDTYDGLSPTHTGGLNGPFRTVAGSGINFETAAAGDQFLFAIGGRWHITTGQYVNIDSNTNVTPTSPIVFASYDQGVGATGKPWLSTANATGNVGGCFLIGNVAAPTTTQGGYTWDGLELDGQGVGYAGIILYGSVTHFTIQNCEIHDMVGADSNGVGIRCAPQSSTAKNYFGLILDNEFYNCLFAGWIGSASDVLIEGNAFHNNGDETSTTHGMYYGSGVAESNRTVIRHNTFTDNNSASSSANGGTLTYRGFIDYIIVENNLILNTFGSYTTQSLGISHFSGYGGIEYHYHSVIRGNTVVNYPVGITYGQAPGIIIENNVIIDTTTGQTATGGGIVGPSLANVANGPDVDDGSATIRNNTIYIANARNSSNGIRISSGAKTNTNINNNVVIYGAIESGTPYAFSLSETDASYANISNNFIGGAFLGWHSGHVSLAAFEAYYDALGSTACSGNVENVTHGLTTPTSGNGWNMAPTSAASPVVDAGSETLGTKLAIDGYARDTSYDIGAFEYGRNP